MSETFRAKVRNVGTSLGILLPKEIAKRENVKVGDDIEVSIFRSLSKDERRKIIEECFGIAKRTKGKLLKFERNHKDHEFDVIR